MAKVSQYFSVKPGPVYSNSYEFQIASSQISGSLATPGAKTITIRNVPPGVNGANTNHYIRISGGTGTAEVVLITGGTAVGGAASGTLQFTTVNAHTGAYRITSATAGVQEAYYANASDTAINTPAGTYTLYAKSTFNGPVSLRGEGDAATFFVLNDPTMDAFVGTTWLNATDMRINSGNAWQTAGAVFKVPSPGRVQVQNVYTWRCFNSVEALVISASDSWFESCVNHAIFKPFSAEFGVIRISNIYADGRYYVSGSGWHNSTVTVVGTTVTRTAGSTFTGLSANGLAVIGGAFGYIASVDGPNQITMQSAPTPGAGQTFLAFGELLAPALVHIEGSVGGATFDNLWFQASQTSVVIVNYTANPTSEMVFGICIFDHDSPSITGISVVNNDLNPLSSSNSIRFSNTYINNAVGYGVLVQYVENFAISNSKIQVSGTFPPVSMTTVVNAEVKANKIFQQPLSNTPYGISIGGTSDKVAIDSNTINLDTDGTYGLIIGSSGITNLSVTGNIVNGGLGLMNTTLDASNLVAKGNFSQQAARSIQVTGTETLVIPAEDESTLMVVNGGGTSTTVATISGGYNGRQVLLYLNVGLTITNTGNILTPMSASSGSLYQATYSSSLGKWMIK